MSYAREKKHRKSERYRARRKEYDHKRAAKAAERVAKLKAEGACVKCGEDHPAALCFHHRDPETRLCGIRDAARRSEKVFLAEVAKCDIMCFNCHEKLHWEEKKKGPKKG